MRHRQINVAILRCASSSLLCFTFIRRFHRRSRDITAVPPPSLKGATSLDLMRERYLSDTVAMPIPR